MNLDLFQQTFHEIRRPLEFLSSKNRIPNTYEMSAKISQNSEKLDNSKKTNQSIDFKLLFLNLKFLKGGSCFLVSQCDKKFDF